MRHAFLVALSFANLCYLRVWSELLTYTPWDTYLMTTPPKPVAMFAASMKRTRRHFGSRPGT